MSSKTSPVSISATSDLFGHLPDIYPCDLAVVCGDIFPGAMDRDPEAQGQWFHERFLPWIGRTASGKVILVPGKHDRWIEEHLMTLCKTYSPSAGHKLVLLCDAGIDFRGLKIYGRVAGPVPQQLDLLLTHDVPAGCGGLGVSETDGIDHGSNELRTSIESRDIRYLIGGHILQPKSREFILDHGNRQTRMFNVSYCDNSRQPLSPPQYMIIKSRPCTERGW